MALPRCLLTVMKSNPTNPTMIPTAFRFLLTLALLLPVSIFAQGKRPEVGEKFPDFSGKTVDGETISLSDYKGKVVLVDFWATWCGPCLRELPGMKETYHQYKDQGFEILGVSLDKSAEALTKFQSDPTRAIPWKTTFDGKGWDSDLGRRFGIQSIPAAFLLDRDGTIVATDLRAAQMPGKVRRLLDPTAPPATDELIVQYLQSAEDDAAKLEPALAAGMSKDDFAAYAMALGNQISRTPASPKHAKFIAANLPNVDEVTPENAMLADVRALVLHQSGDSLAAAELMGKIVALIDSKIDEEATEAEAKAARNSGSYTIPLVKLGLYLGAAGKNKEAAEVLDRVDAVPNPRSAEFFARYPLYIEARKITPKEVAAAESNPAAQP